MSATCPQCSIPVLATATRCGRCGAELKPTKVDRNVGRTVGNLKLVGLLGRGGMGSVYLAEHVSLGTPYAVKVLHPQFSHDDTVAERFRREAVACSRLRHENTVFVTDFGIHDELGIYLVMEYLEGVSYAAMLKEVRRLPLARFAALADQICDAMSAAHRLGIVHRDLKPDNVMVLDAPGRGEKVKVLDFGIAHLRDTDEGDKLTHVGMVVGTPAYMSPEQIDRSFGPVGPQADIYSLGVMFYASIAGRLPYTASGDLMMLSNHLTGTPDPLSSLRPELAGTALEALVHAMLTRSPADRVQSMDDVRALLRDAMADLVERGILEDVAPTPPPRTATMAAPSTLSRNSSPNLTGAPAHTTGQHRAADTTGQNAALRTNPSLHVTGVLKRIRDESPDSPAATLLAALPEADGMRGEALTLAVWGVLQQELLDTPVEEPRFAQSVAHMAMLVEAVLDTKPEAPPSPSQEKVFRSLKNLFTLASPERQRILVDALAQWVDRPNFPVDALPKNLAPNRATKTWDAVRSVMTREINLWPARKSVEPPAPAAPAPEGRVSAPPPEPAAPPAAAAPTPESSLVDKLKKPVTVDAMKAVLTHEFNLFGKKKP